MYLTFYHQQKYTFSIDLKIPANFHFPENNDYNYYLFCYFKGNAKFVQKVTFEPLMDVK